MSKTGNTNPNQHIPDPKADVRKLIPDNNELKARLSKESDRGAILILAAYIEEIIGLIVSDACVSNAAASALLKHGQPAGTFDSRVMLVEALGLVHVTEAKSLRYIQKIRNKAAHFDRTGRGFDVLFDSASTADQVVALAELLGYTTPKREPAVLREVFIDICTNLAFALVARVTLVERAHPAKSLAEMGNDLLNKYKHPGMKESIKFPANAISSEIQHGNFLFMAGLSLQELASGKSLDELNTMLKKDGSETVKIRFEGKAQEE
jgi:hypothetical protein